MCFSSLSEINEETSMQNTFKWDSLAHVKIHGN